MARRGPGEGSIYGERPDPAAVALALVHFRDLSCIARVHVHGVRFMS